MVVMEKVKSKKTKPSFGISILMDKKNWCLAAALIAIFVLALWVRSPPAKYDELQDLDTFYMYRMAKHAVENGLTLPADDYLRYHPNGVNAYKADYPGTVMLPAIVYLTMSAVGISVPFIRFAIMFPAVLGAISCVLMYFVAKEFFDRKVGLISSFFFATIPGFITRTSAGVLEKESTGSVFILLTLIFFLKSYKEKIPKKSWVYGVIAGLSLAALSATWGGSQVIYLLLSLYSLLMLLINRDVDKLLPSFAPMILLGALIPQLYPYHAELTSVTIMPSFLVLGILLIRVGVERLGVVKKENISYVVPAMITAAFVILLVGSVFFEFLSHTLDDLGDYIIYFFGGTPHGIEALSTTVAEQQHGDWDSIYGSSGASYTSMPMASVASLYIFAFVGATVLAILLGRRLFVEKQADWIKFILLIWFFLSIGFVFYMVRLVIIFAFPAVMLAGFLFGYVIDQLQKKAKGTFSEFPVMTYITVGSILVYGTLFVAREAFSANVFGWLTWLMLSVMIFSGIVLYLIFSIIKKHLSPDSVFAILVSFAVMVAVLWYVLPLVSMSSEYALVFFPLLFFAFLYVFLVMEKKINLYSLVLGLFLVFSSFIAVVNLSNAYNYGSALGPLICFPPENGKCLTINDADGTYEFNLDNQDWYQAMAFMKDETPENSSLLSWWDFGYWFQARGNRPSIADGGNINTSVNVEIAQWFTAPPENWSNFEQWLEEHEVAYILMDYTLPGKYGAISRIASNGEFTRGMQQFPFTGTFQQNNRTIYEFSFPTSSNGVILKNSLYVPMSGQSIAGTPQLIISQNDQVLQQSYINDLCASAIEFNGTIIQKGQIIKVGNQTNALPGCIALSSFGVFFIPEDVENTIFTTLMFMDAGDLPLEKVFTSQRGLITIYKTEYASQTP